MDTTTDKLLFLGTAGARIMVTKQLLASGGIWLNLGGVEILLDPGPGCLVQAVKRKLDASKLQAIVLSHKHLDHSGDINIMIEAMTEGGFKRRGLVLAPSDALEKDPVILYYLRGFPERIETLKEGGSYNIGDVRLETPVRHQHNVETYGIVFHTPRHTFSYIADTRYFPDLTKHYKGELIIINVVRLPEGGPYEHLSVPDVRELVKTIKPKAAILTHFGMTLWRGKPWEIAAQLSQETGVRVIAARDGMNFDLAQLEEESTGG